jgi:hypothetical protein
VVVVAYVWVEVGVEVVFALYQTSQLTLAALFQSE